MLMHAGVIGVLFGYTIAFLTYYRERNKVKISSSTFVVLFLMIIIVIVLIPYLSLFAGKLMTADISEYAAKKGAGEGGGSDYLTWLDMSNPTMMLLFSPLKMFYFLYSPIVLDWRGLNDVAAFLMDSLFYLGVSWFAITRKVGNNQLILLKCYLAISIIVTTLLFSFGTANSGTAIRHRAKMSSLMLTLWALSPSRKKNDNRKTKLLSSSVKV
jgi:hypothetical protein